MSDPTQRFSDRVENYVKYRPRYPVAILDRLRDEAGLTPTQAVADIGSGTGILAELFLHHGNPVFGVEPNDAMRAAAERLLAPYDQFYSIAGTAEATSLWPQAVEWITAGQAFHWFDAPAARQEWARILKPNGWVALIWNSRPDKGTPFLEAYEALLQQYGTDYRQVNHQRLDESELLAFFRPGSGRKYRLDNHQRFDQAGLRGRLLSSSYAPNTGHPDYDSMLAALDTLFDEHQQGGQVRFDYHTEIYLGQL